MVKSKLSELKKEVFGEDEEISNLVFEIAE